MPVVKDVHNIHFRNQTNFVDKALAIEKASQLYHELEAQQEHNTIVSLANQRITYRTTTHVLIITCSVFIIS